MAIGGLAVQRLSGELCALAENGDPDAVGWAVDVLPGQGRITEAFKLAARHETEAGARPLWELLARNVRALDAINELYQRIEDDRQGDEGLAKGFLFGRYRDETMRLAQEDPHILANLAFLLHGSGRTEDGIGLLRNARHAGPVPLPGHHACHPASGPRSGR